MTEAKIQAAISELETQRNLFQTRCVALAVKIAELEQQVKELSPPSEVKET